MFTFQPGWRLNITTGVRLRFVAVPLASLWTSPKVSALSGSLRNLRHFLMEEPAVRLSQDGSAVMLKEEGKVSHDAIPL